VYSIYNTLPLERASEGCFGRSVAAGSDRRSFNSWIMWALHLLGLY